jgi:hypothetical protein
MLRFGCWNGGNDAFDVSHGHFNLSAWDGRGDERCLFAHLVWEI